MTRYLADSSVGANVGRNERSSGLPANIYKREREGPLMDNTTKYYPAAFRVHNGRSATRNNCETRADTRYQAGECDFVVSRKTFDGCAVVRTILCVSVSIKIEVDRVRMQL